MKGENAALASLVAELPVRLNQARADAQEGHQAAAAVAGERRGAGQGSGYPMQKIADAAAAFLTVHPAKVAPPPLGRQP